MKKYRLLLFLFMVSCNNHNETLGERTEFGGEPEDTAPLVTIDHPSALSEDLRSLVCDDEGYVADGKSVRPDEMLITWDFNYAVEDPHYNVWIYDDKYIELRENCKKIINESPKSHILSCSVYAGTTGISITSDKVLFGRDPGENLSDKFRIVSFVEGNVLLSYPDGYALKGFYDDKEMTVALWAEMGGMLYGFSMKFDELPSELYEKIEFFIEIKTTESLVLNGSINVAFEN